MPVNEPGSTPRWKSGTPLMTRRGRLVVLASACLVSATMAMVQFRQQPPQQTAVADVQPQPAAVEQPVAKVPAARPAVKQAVSTTSRRPAATASTMLPVPVKSDVAAVVTAPAPRGEQDTVAHSIVTISGCLEQDDERFQLKDTAGENAPRGRSWRSGFLRRSASTIDVIDQTDRHHLPTYVGQRVSVTGMLIDGEMQVRSVSIVAESCQERAA